jgi:hypothetical protein
VADASDGEEGSSPDSPVDWSLLDAGISALRGGSEDRPGGTGVQRIDTLTLSEVVIAILDSRLSYPLAASAALVRERAGAGELIHLVLLDEDRQPLVSEPGTVPAITYAARQLDKDLLGAFGDKEVIVLT